MSFFSEYKKVNKLLQQKQQVIFYAESRHYYQYFERLINDLQLANVQIGYITSDKDDPLLRNTLKNIQTVYVKWLLGFLFSKIKADVMIMTMPDLGNFLFKHSAGVGTYIYVFHAAVSTHQQYRQKAFFNYDAIFCTGNYQLKEIRAAEKIYGLKEKRIVKYGYPLLDKLKEKASIKNEKPVILVAPSWFEGCIFEVCMEELVQQLSTLPYQIILRSHPEYEKRKKKNFNAIQKWIAEFPNVSMDTYSNVTDRLPSTDILITDRSGIAFEFAMGTGRQVLFIETILKQTNPDWKKLGIEPIENELRSQLGSVILPSQLHQLPEKIAELEKTTGGFTDRMDALKISMFYNSAESYKEGLDFVLNKIKKD